MRKRIGKRSTNPRSPIGDFRRYGPAGILPILLIVLSASGFSCKIDYGSDIEAKELHETIPDMIVSDTEYKVIRDGKLVMRMHADTAKVFNTAGSRVLEGVRFEQYDSDGKEIAHGIATKATQSVQTENVEFEGGLEVYLSEEEATIYADALSWNADEKTLKGSQNQRVSVEKKDGSKIEGTDFFADLNTREVELSGGVDGSMSGEDRD